MDNKISKYNIEVEHNEGMLLYNALTNKLLPTTFEDYAVIETLLDNLSVFQNMYPDLYATFEKSGFIVNSDFDELAYIKLQNKRRIFVNKDYHLTINPTLDCNLKCWYCSVDQAGAKHTKERMSDETVNSLNKHIEELVIQQKARSISLDWFGGEPMMYFDEVIRKVSDFAKIITSEHNVDFRQQITTNATLLNEERIRHMSGSNFNYFQIAIDGNEQRHNLIKFYSDKRGTYRDTINNINLITEIFPAISIGLRLNYDEKTLINVRDIINEFSDKSKSSIIVDFQRVWQVPVTDKMKQLLAETKKEFELAGLRTRFWAYKPLTFHRCYADRYNHYVINYDGKVFKCTARDYGDKLVIGELLASGNIQWKDAIMSKMFEKATFENEKCENCKMLPICMGPCIQRCYDARINNRPIECLYKNVEYSLSSYALDMAKQMNLI